LIPWSRLFADWVHLVVHKQLLCEVEAATVDNQVVGRQLLDALHARPPAFYGAASLEPQSSLIAAMA
jgi:hypothetical protein